MRAGCAIAALALAAIQPAHADPRIWTSTYGTATIFDSGDIATTLAADSAVGSTSEVNMLNFLDATTVPATVTANVTKSDASMVATSQLEIDNAQLGGLDQSGGINFTASGTGGTADGTISLYYLISVPDAATIDLSGIRTTVMPNGLSTASFSLSLYQSDSTGAKFGSALFSITGDNFDAEQSYQTSQPYYLLEMDVTANATSDALSSVNFSYSFDLGPATAVPEPNSTALLLLSAVVGLAFKRAFRRRRE